MAKQPMTIVQDQDGVFQRPEDMRASDVPTEPRLRKVPGKVNALELETIMDAISLKRATLSHLSERITDGEALTMIAEEWLAAESARLSGKGQPMKGVN